MEKVADAVRRSLIERMSPTVGFPRFLDPLGLGSATANAMIDGYGDAVDFLGDQLDNQLIDDLRVGIAQIQALSVMAPRAPDYVVLEVSASLGGGVGGSVLITRNGSVGLGIAGVAGAGVSFGGRGGWKNQQCVPTGTEVDDMLHGWGANVSASFYGEVAIYDSRAFDWDEWADSFSPQAQISLLEEAEAFEVGGGSVGVTASYGHTWWVKQQLLPGWRT